MAKTINPTSICNKNCKEAFKHKNNFYCKLKTQNLELPTPLGLLQNSECTYYRKVK